MVRFIIRSCVIDTNKEWCNKKQGKLQEGIWLKKLKSYKIKFPKKYTELQRRLKNKLPAIINKKL